MLRQCSSIIYQHGWLLLLGREKFVLVTWIKADNDLMLASEPTQHIFRLGLKQQHTLVTTALG